MVTQYVRTLVALFVWGFTSVSALAQTDENYTETMLKGVRTAVISFTEKDTLECPFERGIEKKAAPAIDVLNSLGLNLFSFSSGASPSFLSAPDVSILVLLESRKARGLPEGTACNLFVKFEVVHFMKGELGYSGANPLLRVIVYRTFQFGSAPPNQLTVAMYGTALRALSDFADAYEAANRKK